MINRGQLVLDEPMDQVKERYRYVQAVFPNPVHEADFHFPGIEGVTAEGRAISFVASHNVDAIVQHVLGMRANTVDVLPISLKELFLEKVKAK